MAIPELGVHATGLPHLEYLLAQSTQAVVLGRHRVARSAARALGMVASEHAAGRDFLHGLARRPR